MSSELNSRKKTQKRDLLSDLREGRSLSEREQLALVAKLSLPAMLAEVTSVLMEYIDASMVGRMGAEKSAAVGLVSTTTWLFFALGAAWLTGFSVQVAQLIGAQRPKDAKEVMKQGWAVIMGIALVLTTIGLLVSGVLPAWLGGEEAIRHDATVYFRIVTLTLPIFAMNHFAGAMLQSSGNMKTPGIIYATSCLLDIVFNFFFIFETREVSFLGMNLIIPGAGLNVAGAALGTLCADTISMLCMSYFLYIKSPSLHLERGDRIHFTAQSQQKAAKIATPVLFERFVMQMAMVMTTRIVAPLGAISIAANSFAITAESLCYMPGYGIANAAQTLIGQSIGAERKDYVKRFGWITTITGMVVMGVIGVLMYLGAPAMIGILTPVPEIRTLGVKVLRIEAFAEPLFAASIVGYGVLCGAGDTLAPSLMNFISIWGVRLTLASILVKTMGLEGVWIAMAVELCFRGMLYLIRLARGKWLTKGVRVT